MKRWISTLVLTSFLFAIAAAATDDTKAGKKAAKPATTTADTTSAGTAASSSFNGWVSDEKCGAKIDAQCNKACYDRGVRLVFVNTNNEVVPVANQDALKDFLGQKVTVQGKIQNGTLTVASIKSAK